LLDAVAAAETDLKAARRVQAERRELFLHIGDGMAVARVPPDESPPAGTGSHSDRTPEGYCRSSLTGFFTPLYPAESGAQPGPRDA